MVLDGLEAAGNVTLAREEAREVWAVALIERVWRDSVYGARKILKRGEAESVVALPVTADFFQLIGLAPKLGRPLGGGEQAPAAVLSDTGWRRLFGSDPSIVGRSVTLDEEQYRLASRTSIAQAEAEAQALLTSLSRTLPERDRPVLVHMYDLQSYFTGFNWRQLYFFLGAAALVLVLACLNVSNLLAARALRRQREFAIRAALGGGTAALIRQTIVEGALIAIATLAGLMPARQATLVDPLVVLRSE